VALDRGGFLAELALSRCAPFEEWALLKADEFQRIILGALGQLAEGYEAQGDYSRALGCVRRQLALSPWEEAAYRAAMRLLVLTGHRAEALAQFKHCRKALMAEFGAEPTATTSKLYQRICQGDPSSDVAELR